MNTHGFFSGHGKGQDAAALGSHAPAPRGSQEDASVGGVEPTAHGQRGAAAEDLRPAQGKDGGARTFLGSLVLVVECLHKPWLNGGGVEGTPQTVMI